MLSFARLRSGGFTFLEVQASVILIAIAIGGLAILLMSSSRQNDESRKIDSIFSFVSYVPTAAPNFLLVTEISTGTVTASYQAVIESVTRNNGTSQTTVVNLYPN